MPRSTLTGTRIRERRMMRGMRQAELARQAGISASYLNLIEHNRRRIGGKLLLDIATALDVEPSLLSEGAEAALLASLRQAAADRPEAGAEIDRVEELAGRFPGWARLLVLQRRRLGGLEQAVEALTDRLEHDPHLAASMHEVLSTVTAIHSAAEILIAERDIEPEWRARFHRNIAEDSARLASGARSLIEELGGSSRRDVALSGPQDEMETFFTARGYHFPMLENGADPDMVEEVIAGAGDMLSSAAARHMTRRVLRLYVAEAAELPAEKVLAALPLSGPVDPLALAARFGADPGAMIRRLTMLPEEKVTAAGQAPLGMVACDASGTLIFRKPLNRFPLPRFGSACPLWPLFQALSRPMMPLREVLRLSGRAEGVFVTHAIAQPDRSRVPNRDPMFNAYMLIQRSASDDPDLPQVGVTCRICTKADCRGRREPSILGELA